MNIGEAIKKIRWEMRLSQADLAKEVSCSQVAISAWENGIRTPNYKILKRIDEYAKKHKLKIVLL